MKKILIIDDDIQLRTKCQKELTACGYHILIAENGREALKLFKSKNPDLVVMDLVLPDLLGFDVLNRMLGINPTIPVIIHSIYGHFKADFMSWSAEKYILKSSDLTELRKTIEQLFGTTEIKGLDE